MSEPGRPGGADGGVERESLNPAMKRRTDASHPTGVPSPAPVDSASVQHEEGRSWPVIWAVVTVLCVIAAIYFLI